VKYSLVRLGEICEFTYGDGLKETNRKGGKIPVYGSNGIVGWHDKSLTKGETIIVGRKGSIGEIHLSKVPCWPIDTTYYIDKAKTPCDFTWLYYMLLVLDLTRLNKSAAVPGLNRDDAYEQQLPLPTLPEQQRIAAILQKADRLRRLRRYARWLSDTYLQSVFLEMFGDPDTNPKGWEIDSLDRILLETKNGFGQRFDFSPQGTIVLRIRDVSAGFIDYSDPRRMIINPLDIKDYRLEGGDLLFVRVNGNPELVGRVAVFEEQGEEILFSDHLIRAKVDRKLVEPIYLSEILNSAYGHRQTRNVVITTAGQFTINRTGLSTIKIPYPPIKLQQRFLSIYHNFMNLKLKQKASERQAEQLFQSLLQRAFQGD
jgi:type I restriction enzyme S subunit